MAQGTANSFVFFSEVFFPALNLLCLFFACLFLLQQIVCRHLQTTAHNPGELICTAPKQRVKVYLADFCETSKALNSNLSFLGLQSYSDQSMLAILPLSWAINIVKPHCISININAMNFEKSNLL